LPFHSQRRRRSTVVDRAVDIEVGRRSAWIRGTGIARLLDEIASPRMWCPRQKCLTCPVDRVDDLLRLLEDREGRYVELTAVDR
jgi:hypothetical protein